MSVESFIQTDGSSLTIQIEGHFNKELKEDFKEAYEQSEGQLLSFILDMTHATSLDESSISMLQSFYEHVGESDVQIVGSNDDVREFLNDNELDELFRIY
jgi:anti-anti-sigma regulatory factor